VRVAVAGIADAWSSERMAAALADVGVESFVMHLADAIHDIARDSVTHLGEDLCALDGVVVKKLGDQADAASRLRLHALRALERAGVRVFSPADVIDVAMDRYRMMMVLAEQGLPVPDTLAVESFDGLREAVGRMGDCVVKPIYTSKARGMIRIKAPEQLDAMLGEWMPQRCLVQRFVEAPGRDIGATVVGGEFIGAFARVAQPGEWRTTTLQGGRYERHDLPAEGIELAERAARAFGLDYTVVDLVEQDGGYLLYEVSAFGGFRGLYEATGIDPSSAYAALVKRELEG
jgi:ribosomal protein S6--L-glutamate ligase